MNGNIDALDLLIKNFAAIDPLSASTLNKQTPLHYAITYNKLIAVKKLIANGASVCLQDGDGSTAFHIAVAVSSPNLDILDTLLLADSSKSTIALTLRDKKGQTPLHEAILNRVPVEFLTRLLSSKVEIVNIKDDKGRTPLHFAVYVKKLDYLAVLLKGIASKTININLQDEGGCTAMHYAVKDSCSIAIIQYLHIQGGIDLNTIKDKYGKTAGDYAKNVEIKNYFKNPPNINNNNNNNNTTNVPLVITNSTTTIVSSSTSSSSSSPSSLDSLSPAINNINKRRLITTTTPITTNSASKSSTTTSNKRRKSLKDNNDSNDNDNEDNDNNIILNNTYNNNTPIKATTKRVRRSNEPQKK
jgi:ankyrin repeat protein